MSPRTKSRKRRSGSAGWTASTSARGILACLRLLRHAVRAVGQEEPEEALFGWIVSDFGLNDAIESGLVKTPRVVVRDDAVPNAKTYKSRLYHIYNDPEVKDDLNRKAEQQEPLPDLVINGYYLLGYDWLETAKNWASSRAIKTPPVMITVANRTETAARVKYAFDHKKIRIDELCDARADAAHRLQGSGEGRGGRGADRGSRQATGRGRRRRRTRRSTAPSRKLTKKQQAELLRQKVDTVGQLGKPGEQIQNVISVGMLSEGWDAKTVTHIMGLRAFTSQLLCEQVVGRGLRRTAYELNPETGLFEPEYVNIFGVPFTFLPHEAKEGAIPPRRSPRRQSSRTQQRRRSKSRGRTSSASTTSTGPAYALDWEQGEAAGTERQSDGDAGGTGADRRRQAGRDEAGADRS